MGTRKFYVERLPEKLRYALETITETVHISKTDDLTVTLLKVECYKRSSDQLITLYRRQEETSEIGSNGVVSKLEYIDEVKRMDTKPLVMNTLILTIDTGYKVKITRLPYDNFEELTYITYYNAEGEDIILPSWVGGEFDSELSKVLEYGELHDIINEHKYTDIRLLLEPYILVASKNGGNR